MRPYYEQSGVTIYHGDCRGVLPCLPDACADVVITDPVWPNAVAVLAGSDDPYGLFASTVALLPRLTNRLAVHLGCDSDPRFLASVPSSLRFLRACSLEYSRARPKGRILYTGDMAYVFGAAPKARPGRMIIPGRVTSWKHDQSRPRRRKASAKAFEGQWTEHPCPRRLQHCDWLVKWLADGLVLDPFMGIGTTLVAAKNGGLRAIGIEIEEVFCERAAKRLQQEILPCEVA